MKQNEIISNLRKEKGLTLEELSSLTNISRNMLWHLEKGSRTGTIETIKKLADFYNVSLDYITCRPINSMVDDMIRVLVNEKIIIPDEPIDKKTQELIIEMIETSLKKQRKRDQS